MDIKLITDALLIALPYVSHEGSASDRMLILKAIKEVSPNLPWIDKRIAEQEIKVKIENDWLDKN
jgi:hypothetical protein